MKRTYIPVKILQSGIEVEGPVLTKFWLDFVEWLVQFQLLAYFTTAHYIPSAQRSYGCREEMASRSVSFPSGYDGPSTVVTFGLLTSISLARTIFHWKENTVFPIVKHFLRPGSMFGHNLLFSSMMSPKNNVSTSYTYQASRSTVIWGVNSWKPVNLFWND